MKQRIIALALMLVSLAFGGVSSFAESVGEWHLYSLFSGGITKIVDAKNKVYYVSANRLFSYDKRTTETYSYSSENVLNDTNIKNIYYNADKGFLMVVYDTTNIDIILDKDDSVINMSDISIANLTYTKVVNDVAFGKDRIFVATDFGLVVFDSDKFTVVESGIYGTNVDFIAASGDYLVLSIYQSADQLYHYYYSPIKDAHNTFDKFKESFAAWTHGIYGTGDGFCENYDGNRVRNYKMDWTTGTLVNTTIYTTTGIKSFNKNTNGDTYIVAKDKIMFIDEQTGEVTSTVDMPSELASQQVDFCKDLSSVWAGDAQGIGCYDITNGTAEVVQSKATPSAITCDQVAFIRPAKDGSRVYISNIGNTRFKSIGTTSNGDTFQQHTDVIIDGVPYDASLTNASLNKPYPLKWQTASGTKAMFGGTERFDVDPEDPECYVISNFFEGFFVCKNQEELLHINSSNAPIWNWWTKGSPGAVGGNVEFDPQGNLWVGYWAYGCSNSQSCYLMLPKKYYRGDLSAITEDMWQYSKHAGIDQGGKDMGSLFCKKNNIWFTWHSADGNPLGVYDTKGTYDDTSDDYYFELEGLKDTDGGTFKPSRWICAAEDQNGAVWFGTSAGIGKIPDPTKVKDVSYQITRPKVPRNDGTNYADYLLESEQINDISVDPSNRKWICTENSGVYCVSADGDEIIEQFTTDNSPLPSNSVYSVYCDPNSNLIYFGLATGLITYRSNSSPAQSDFSAVLAYPNPVRPDYTGYITVSGLMDNTLVKFADASGNVVYQTRSNGGMATWDGLKSDGTRVNTGVYFVLASQNEDDTATAVVTKILVVK